MNKYKILDKDKDKRYIFNDKNIIDKNCELFKKEAKIPIYKNNNYDFKNILSYAILEDNDDGIYAITEYKLENEELFELDVMLQVTESTYKNGVTYIESAEIISLSPCIKKSVIK